MSAAPHPESRPLEASGTPGGPSDSEEPWYLAAFRSGYRDVYPHRDLDSARREARWLVDQGVRGRVLDLCCGFGRHSLAMAEIGCEVVGLDFSADLLRQARELEGAHRIAGRLVRGDARVLPFADARFDSVVVLFSSFGYFGDAGDARMLSEIERVLARDGLVVLDLMNPAYIRSTLVPHTRTQRGELVIDETRRLDRGGIEVVKDVDVTDAVGASKRRRWTERVRLYDPPAVREVLAGFGLGVVSTHGDFDSSAYSDASARQIVLARRLG